MENLKKYNDTDAEYDSDPSRLDLAGRYHQTARGLLDRPGVDRVQISAHGRLHPGSEQPGVGRFFMTRSLRPFDGKPLSDEMYLR